MQKKEGGSVPCGAPAPPPRRVHSFTVGGPLGGGRPPQPPLPGHDGGRAGSVRWLARAARARPGRRGEGRSGEALPAVDGQRAPGLRAPTRSEHRRVGGRRARPPRRCRETKPSGRGPKDPRADPGDTRTAHRPRRATRSRHDLRGHVCHAARHPVGTGEGGTTAAPPLCGRCRKFGHPHPTLSPLSPFLPFLRSSATVLVCLSVACTRCLSASPPAVFSLGVPPCRAPPLRAHPPPPPPSPCHWLHRLPARPRAHPPTRPSFLPPPSFLLAQPAPARRWQSWHRHLHP